MSIIVSSYFAPANVQEAVSLKRKLRDKALVVAGGTSTVQLINKMIIEPPAIISLERVPLDYVKIRANSVEIGATTSIARLVESRGLPNALKKAAESVHGLALKDMATVGGNIFTPAPAGDIATALLSLDAVLILRGGKGTRSVPLSKFYKGPLQFNIRSDEILTAVRINKPPKFSAFLKQTPWKYSGPTIASVSVSLDLDKNGKARRVMVALGCLTTHPYRAKKVEKMITGEKLTKQLIDRAAQQLTDGVEVIEDALASSWYRRELAQVLFKRILYNFISRGD
ncbi:MAG: FAD binding domain-containing protein [Nitrososphaerota archaeon]